ncbi:MAG: putative molybdopterin biosynthesis protein [Bacillota bacterium]|jgi:molybdopterin molybdotransferase|nr:putative molybdopterin biosynthesis protein [Bacillota bacterium]
MNLFKVFTVKDTKNLINDNFNYEMQVETINIIEATGRIIKDDIKAPVNVPDFKRSTVDGYAVLSRDLFGASESIPALLNYKGEILMGEEAIGEIKMPGDCYYVPTGGMLPCKSDSVIMIEYTQKLDENTILGEKSVSPNENVIDIGEDIKKGEIVIKKGTKLRAYEIGVLSSLGISKIEVYKAPVIGIISTGDEIVDCEETPKIGQIRDINTYLLYSLCVESGCEPKKYGLIKDDFNLLKQTVEKAVEECDIVLMSGGSSVGKKDHTVNVINSLGDEGVLVHGISVKPGKPTIIGKAKNKIIFGLPGHPLACAVIFKTMVKYYIDKILNYHEISYPVKCKFSINYHGAKGREEYLPVILSEENEEIIAKPIFGKSGLITGFSRAWGYVKIERNEEGIKEGQFVDVYKF